MLSFWKRDSWWGVNVYCRFPEYPIGLDGAFRELKFLRKIA